MQNNLTIFFVGTIFLYRKSSYRNASVKKVCVMLMLNEMLMLKRVCTSEVMAPLYEQKQVDHCMKVKTFKIATWNVHNMLDLQNNNSIRRPAHR